jgi:hypothetical protein
LRKFFKISTKKAPGRVAHNLERERENDGFFWEEEVFASRRVVISGSCSLPSSSSSRFGGFVDKGIKKSKDDDWKKEIHGGTKSDVVVRFRPNAEYSLWWSKEQQQKAQLSSRQRFVVEVFSDVDD